MSEWQDIAGAARDGSKVLCGWPGGGYDLLIWKRNDRIVHGQAYGGFEGYATDYFGDPEDWDDYDLAKPENFPTLYLPIPPLSAPPVKG